MPFQFDNTYLKLDPSLYSSIAPTEVNDPSLAIFNSTLANYLGLNIEGILEDELANYFSGNKLIAGSHPIAQAYAGHQFGHFNKLGDGRAILLGEHITPSGSRFDIQLKGSGITPYSRRGDGRATLSSMLREYVMSEAMFSLGVPTTRSLAVIRTGENIYRESAVPGAVLTRIAASHIRVGTFQYVRNFHSKEVLQEFTTYTIQRHYSELLSAENSALALLKKVMEVQIKLIVNWMRVGFIHGVMNTDNMSISGETIDYGPCAFMNVYDPDTVFSSIDEQGRYAFGRQADTALWNITRLAEALLPVIDKNTEVAIEKATRILETYSIQFNEAWLNMMCKKIGITDVKEGDALLVSRLLDWMNENKADYTNTFIQLSVPNFSKLEIYKQHAFVVWLADWKKRIKAENGISRESLELMQTSNPVYIPRNQIVEAALKQAQEKGDITQLNNLLKILNTPYSYNKMNPLFQNVPSQFDENYKTYCGT
jgi:serine/tyrosine/threonine adenylyltransferase